METIHTESAYKAFSSKDVSRDKIRTPQEQDLVELEKRRELSDSGPNSVSDTMVSDIGVSDSSISGISLIAVRSFPLHRT